MKVGIFADGIWGLNFIKLLSSDKNFIINFVVLRQKIDQNIFNYCNKKNLKYFSFKNINNKKNINILNKFNSDISISMSYNQIFDKNFLNIYKNRIINCHAGALPFYRGRSPINWAIINGEKKIGITTHIINTGIDKGDILDQKFIIIKKEDNYKSILNKCYKLCPKQLYGVLKKLKNKSIKSKKQSLISKKGSYYFKRKKGDEIINFNESYINVNNFIRGLVFPSVGATFFYNKKKFKVNYSNLVKNKKIKNIKNGTVIDVTKTKLKIKLLNAIIYFGKIYYKNSYITDLKKNFKKYSILKGKNV